jgi:hypothetical protein
LHEDFHDEHPAYYWRPRYWGWGSWGRGY